MMMRRGPLKPLFPTTPTGKPPVTSLPTPTPSPTPTPPATQATPAAPKHHKSSWRDNPIFQALDFFAWFA